MHAHSHTYTHCTHTCVYCKLVTLNNFHRFNLSPSSLILILPGNSTVSGGVGSDKDDCCEQNSEQRSSLIIYRAAANAACPACTEESLFVVAARLRSHAPSPTDLRSHGFRPVAGSIRRRNVMTERDITCCTGPVDGERSARCSRSGRDGEENEAHSSRWKRDLTTANTQR